MAKVTEPVGDRVRSIPALEAVFCKTLVRKFRKGHPKISPFGLPLTELKILLTSDAT